MARSLLAPVRRLHAAALEVARNRLPGTIERIREGEDVRWETLEPIPVHSEEEIGQLARAFDDMHQQAVRLAIGEQAELRLQVSEMFMTLSRRSQSLVELQLSVIEDLEADEQDPQRLGELFEVDHIATRLRRNGENLQVLAGGRPARRDHGPVATVPFNFGSCAGGSLSIRSARSAISGMNRENSFTSALGWLEISPCVTTLPGAVESLWEHCRCFLDEGQQASIMSKLRRRGSVEAWEQP